MFRDSGIDSSGTGFDLKGSGTLSKDRRWIDVDFTVTTRLAEQRFRGRLTNNDLESPLTGTWTETDVHSTSTSPGDKEDLHDSEPASRGTFQFRQVSSPVMRLPCRDASSPKNAHIRARSLWKLAHSLVQRQLKQDLLDVVEGERYRQVYLDLYTKRRHSPLDEHQRAQFNTLARKLPAKVVRYYNTLGNQRYRIVPSHGYVSPMLDSFLVRLTIIFSSRSTCFNCTRNLVGDRFICLDCVKPEHGPFDIINFCSLRCGSICANSGSGAHEGSHRLIKLSTVVHNVDLPSVLRAGRDTVKQYEQQHPQSSGKTRSKTTPVRCAVCRTSVMGNHWACMSCEGSIIINFSSLECC